MKAIISIMIIIIGVLVFVVVDNDTPSVNTAQSIDQSIEATNTENDLNSSTENTAGTDQKLSKSSDSTKLYAESTAVSTSRSASDDASRYGNTNSSYYEDNSSYNSQSSSYGAGDNSYNQDSSYYGNSGSSYSQDNSSNANSSSNSQVNNNTFSNNQNDGSNTLDSETSEEVDSNEDSETTEEEITENLKYQRLYDNGIMWYGNTGTLMIEYESSHAETTGIGFRVHFDSKSIRPVNITQFPVDAIITTTPNTVMADNENRDNYAATDSFLPFAWASIYGQWPQSNKLNLASIDFEKVNGGSNDYTVNYSVVSVPAGFKLIQ